MGVPVPVKDKNGVWQYGESGDLWPVQPGDIWEAGPALLACGDLQRGAALELMKDQPIALFYSDPPWDPGNARSFRTKAGVNTGPVDFNNLLFKVVEAAQLSKGEVYLEMGKRYADELAKIVIGMRGQLVGRWGITYYKKHPMVLFQFDFHGSSVMTTGSSPEGMDDEDTPSWAISRGTKLGDMVADCCMGRGLTCRSAVTNGRRFIGTELHPRRLAVAIQWLSEQGFTPKKVGELSCMKEGK